MTDDHEMSRFNISPELPIPTHLVGEVQSKLAYVDERIQDAQVSSTGDSINLKLHKPVDQEQQEAIEIKVQKVVTTMVKGAFKPKVLVLEEHMDRQTPYHKDPMAVLAERGEIFQEQNGVYSLGPMTSKLIDYFESLFLKLADSFDAAPYRFPTLIPAKSLERVDYFNAFPHSLTFVTHLREDLDTIDQFAKQASCDDRGLTTSMDTFSQIRSLLSPAVCYHLYFALADKPLPGGKIAATAVGSCFRYESINLSSLERLWDFTMREIIFVGSKNYVLENREIARQRMEPFFDEIGLAYRVESANDPFFIGEFRKQVAFQSAFQLKFEICAQLPFKDSTLAIGSYNYHQDFFGRHLNITLEDGSPAHTSCVAFGLERVVYAFLAQFGPEPENWPTSVKDALQ
ncbi:MAG: hypothetical protein U9R58_05000 [Chloroflexota bacterium]|nr:hypothetical protein [Chloroflexota bacterium]